ncbi:hypothetical protein IHV12_22095 [Fictibacillus sp. 7GRE50]|uniref:hypothetical protein n=1 Tax=unclassified Fictibacillus TaxID=2644029 RepID=UPI0018CEC5FC|nr:MULTISPECIES: hypothetical protein [unclassified Fictibacillus]MBH0167604.1 hypothetical protein [Fictibacillus sp. 7GRE50]MBH0176142.1 hypothetical protein [Fictibacillus sp. 23RED33]
MTKLKFLFITTSIALMVSGCSSNESTSGNKEKQEQESKSEKESVKVTDKKAKAPKDQGEYEVWFEGEADRKGKLITVKGQTNLISNSNLLVTMDSVEDTLIGGSDRIQVSEDGTFETDLKIPKSSEGLIEVKIEFDPHSDNQPIKDHYGENGEKLKGPFVRLQEESDMQQNITLLTLEIPQDESNASAKIKKPEWEKPEDYGAPTIRLDEPDIQKDDKYLYIEGKSNLLEGTRLKGSLDIPNYIVSGLSDVTNVNPDGSYKLIIEKPSSMNKLKDVKEYEVVLSVSPADNQWKSNLEVYGVNGEKFMGDYVVDQNGVKEIEKRLSISE